MNEVEKWKLESEIHRAQLDNLFDQVNPHFLFNSLNNIRSMILEDKHRARDMITSFAELFRYALLHTGNKKVKLSEELNMVNQYLTLAKIQYEEKLQYDIKTDEGIKGLELPPMTIQVPVENAVKHGVAQSYDQVHLYISTEIREDKICIEVKKSGKISQTKKLESSLGLGLNNLRERLRLLYNNKAYFDIKEENSFVIVTIKIPVA